MRVALVYDWIVKWGGAERVLLALHTIFPKAPLYTSVYNKKRAEWADVFDVKTSFPQKLPFAKTNHEYLLPLMPLAFESFNFDNYDLVISVVSALAKGIITKPKTFHLCYCLTPPRYLWLNEKDYAKFGAFNFLWQAFSLKARLYDQIAAQRVDKFLAISRTTADRISKYYQVDAEVLYPPADFTDKETKPKLAPDNFFLVVSRLVDYKKVDIVIEAFNELGKNLIIVGTGRAEEKLKRTTRVNICFLKNLTDSKLSWYYRHCQALVMPQEEDFGLAAVEAQKRGTPVIAYRAGGALETIIENKTGCFFYPQNSLSLLKAVQSFKKEKYKRDDCIKNAERFSEENFRARFLKIIAKLNLSK